MSEWTGDIELPDDPYGADLYDETQAPGGSDLATAERLAELETSVRQLSATLAEVITRRESDGQQAPWCYHEPPDLDTEVDADGAEPLDRWVAWANSTYSQHNWPGSGRLLVPVCWRRHSALAAEVATLMWTWQRAFIDSAATTAAAQDFHDRWLPGFIRRTPEWVESGCLKGSCRSASRP